MKKILRITAGILAFIFPSCDQIEPNDAFPGQAEKNVLTASIETHSTKTAMSDLTNGGFDTLWSEDDIIAVYVDESEEAALYKLIDGAGQTTAKFSGYGSGDKYVGYYPSCHAGEYIDGTINVTLPAEQVYANGSYAANTFPMAAVSTDSNLKFHNLCSVLKLSVTGSQTVETIVFKSNDPSVAVSGPASVHPYSAFPELQMSSDASNEVILKCGVVLSKTVPTDFHIVIPAQIYTGGFTIEINTSTGSMSLSTDEDIVMERSQIRAIPTFECILDKGINPSESLSGRGTETDPFLVNTVEDLLLVQAAVNSENGQIVSRESAGQTDAKTASYLLTADIDLIGLYEAGIESWTPIGNYDYDETYVFQGIFDGGGHHIANLRIDAKGSHQGLFGFAQSTGYGGKASIKNLTVSGTVRAYSYSGLICGEILDYFSIENCIVLGTVETEAGGTGGIVGGARTGLLSDCINYATIIGNGNYVGGITGSASRSVINCFNHGDVSNTGRYTGGIQGYHNAGYMFNCQNDGSVSGTVPVGGISGYVRQGAQIVNCNNTGNVYASEGYAGGVVGHCDAYEDADFNTAVLNCINVGKVTVAQNGYYADFIGGICGQNNSTVKNCYWLAGTGPASGIGNETGVSSDIIALTEEQMRGNENASTVLYRDEQGVYTNIVDALNAYAAGHTNDPYWGWTCGNGDHYPEFTGSPAEYPGGSGQNIFEINPTSFNVDASGGDISVAVTTNIGYHFTGAPDWISEKNATTEGMTTTHVFTVAPNENTEQRKGVISFCNDNDVCIPVVVTQEARIEDDDNASIWDNKALFYHRSLAMRFTATWCGWCPRMATSIKMAQGLMPNKIETVAIHGGGSDLEFNQNYALGNQYQISGFPSTIVDGRALVENFDSDYTANLITQKVQETEQNYPSSAGIAFASSLSGQELIVNLSLYLKKADSYKVTVLVTEENIIGYQTDYEQGDHSDYVHNHIARISLTDIEGDAFTTSEDHTARKFSYKATIPSHYDKNNLRILVYVQRAFGSQKKIQSGSYGNYYVDNCASADAGTQYNIDDGNMSGGNEDIIPGDDIIF